MSNQKSRRGEKKNQKQNDVQAKRPEAEISKQRSKPSINRGSGPSRTTTEVQVQADSRAALVLVVNAVDSRQLSKAANDDYRVG
jgi:hypothetical protein